MTRNLGLSAQFAVATAITATVVVVSAVFLPALAIVPSMLCGILFLTTVCVFIGAIIEVVFCRMTPEEVAAVYPVNRRLNPAAKRLLVTAGILVLVAVGCAAAISLHQSRHCKFISLSAPSNSCAMVSHKLALCSDGCRYMVMLEYTSDDMVRNIYELQSATVVRINGQNVTSHGGMGSRGDYFMTNSFVQELATFKSMDACTLEVSIMQVPEQLQHSALSLLVRPDPRIPMIDGEMAKATGVSLVMLIVLLLLGVSLLLQLRHWLRKRKHSRKEKSANRPVFLNNKCLCQSVRALLGVTIEKAALIVWPDKSGKLENDMRINLTHSVNGCNRKSQTIRIGSDGQTPCVVDEEVTVLHQLADIVKRQEEWRTPEYWVKWGSSENKLGYEGLDITQGGQLGNIIGQQICGVAIVCFSESNQMIPTGLRVSLADGSVFYCVPGPTMGSVTEDITDMLSWISWEVFEVDVNNVDEDGTIHGWKQLK